VSAVPPVQFLHCVLPIVLYEPLEHAEHGVVGSLSRSAVPDTQNKQTIPPPGAYWPAKQVLHCVAEFESKSTWPAPHDVQFVPPIEASVFVNEPAAHAMQAVWPSLPWY
jgi:hypothetical protein